MLLTEKNIIDCISKVLQISKKITINSNSKNIEEWDSLAHLNILMALDKKANGKIFSIKEIAKATSVKEIIQILKKKKFLKYD